MLVDPRIQHQQDHVLLNILKEAIKDHPQHGIYIYHGFNFNHMIKNKYNHYPIFHNYLDELEFVKKMFEKHTDLASYYKSKIEEYQSLPPADVIMSLYRWENWPEPDEDFDEQYESRYLNSYGVCDSPEQLLSLYDFEKDPRKLCIAFTELLKEDQEPSGGWRWHKWGPYIGKQKPQYEYLFDEPIIERVYVYHIIELLD
jgi:hypothetical protein